MSDKVVDFAPRRAAAAKRRRAAHIDNMVEIVISAIQKMRELGADSRAIAQTLRVIAKEMETDDAISRAEEAGELE